MLLIPNDMTLSSENPFPKLINMSIYIDIIYDSQLYDYLDYIQHGGPVSSILLEQPPYQLNHLR